MNDSFGSRATQRVGGREFRLARLDALEKRGFNVSRLPYALRILLENLLRREDGAVVTAGDIEALAGWDPKALPSQEIAFMPARVLLQDFTGVPAVVDLAAMRDAMVAMGGDPKRINPLQPVELVIDHSVQVDEYGTAAAFLINAEKEFERNRERYAFLRWGQTAFSNFRVVPPDTGIVHQVNLEYLARVVMEGDVAGESYLYPDTLVGTDSHTTMVNGLGVLGWGVGGIEAEAAMLGQPVSMLIPQVVGFRLAGQLPEGATATDLVLTVTQMLRKRGVVGKFVEFFGPGLATLPLADRATIGNMAPEYGATCGIFPVDQVALDYLKFTGRSPEQVAIVEAYMKEQGLFHTADSPEAAYTDTLELDLGTVEPSLAGPRRPQDRVRLSDVKPSFLKELEVMTAAGRTGKARPTAYGLQSAGGTAAGLAIAEPEVATAADPAAAELRDGSVVIAAITELHQHLEPLGDDRRRPAGPAGGREGARQQALGQDQPRPGLEGGHRVLQRGGAHPLPRPARLQPRRLRLHHLHRQQRPAPAGDLEDHRGARPGRGRRALRQPQLRRAHQLGRARQLPGLAAAGRRLRPRRADRRRLPDRAARHRQGRPAGLPARRLADPPGGGGDHPARRPLRHVPRPVPRRLRRRRALERPRRPARRHLRLGPGLDLRPPAPLLRRHAGRAGAGRGHPRRPRARGLRRQHHHRPHLAGRLDQGRQPRRPVPGRPRRRRPRTSTPTAPAAAITR